MNFVQIALLCAEAAVMVLVVLGLFRVRTVLGLSPLYIVIGGFQYLESSLGLRVELSPGWAIYPSSVMFTATLMAVLLVYIKEETREARKLVYGLVLANAGLSILALVISLQMRFEGSVARAGLTIGGLRFTAWVGVVGTVLLLIDTIGIILVYEYVSRYTRSLFVRTGLALIAIGVLDGALFTLALQGWEPTQVLQAVVGKAVAAAAYAAALTLYLRHLEPQKAREGNGDVADVFQTLTYRQLYEQARSRMTRDALTGLYNRGYFDEVLPKALAQAMRYQHPLSVLLVDVDRFKEINDTHSHMVGDRVLRLVGELLNQDARAADTVCRYGGDEFVVILASTDGPSAAAFASRFQARLRERASVALAGGVVDITATVGIATFLEDRVDTPEDLLQVADSRLYMGKRGGRDRVVWRDVSAAAS